MDVTILGTGSAFPSGRRVQSGTVIERNGSRLLVDCGSGVLHRLGAVGEFSFLDLDTVLLTHLHLDHVSDLPGLFKARILRGEANLSVVGPPGTHDACASLFAVDDLTDRGEATITERTVADAPFAVGPFTVAAAEGSHSQRSHAYRFGDSLTLSGDTAVDSSVLSLADGCHTLVHECSYPDGVDTDSHTTPSKLAAAVQNIDIERLFLTHLFPEAERQESAIVDLVAEASDAAVEAATDLTRFSVPG